MSSLNHLDYLLLSQSTVLYSLSETILANLDKPEAPCDIILIYPHFLFSHMELVSCHNSLLLGYTEIPGPVLLLSDDSQVLVVLLHPRFLWALGC